MRERHERIIRAEKRKKQCRYLIESFAREKGVTVDIHQSRLAASGIRLYLDPYEKWSCRRKTTRSS